MKKNVKVMVLSPLLTVRDIIVEALEKANEIMHHTSIILSEIRYDTALLGIDLCTCPRNVVVTKRTEFLHKIVAQICSDLSDYILFGPFIPGKIDEVNLMKSIISEVMSDKGYCRKHVYEVWKRNPPVFVPIYQFENEKIKKDFMDLNICYLEGITSSLTNNGQLVYEYFVNLDSEKKILAHA